MNLTRRSWMTATAAWTVGLSGCGGSPRSSQFEIVNEFPHDETSYTQGLLFANGHLYESAGRFGHSTIRRVDLQTGRTLQQTRLKDEYFGEGIALWGDEIIQLTWQNGIGIVYDRPSLQFKRAFEIAGEGWGICAWGDYLVLSDGSSTLRLLDPRRFRVQGTVRVRDGGRPVPRLNELELVEGEIYANVWQTDRIVRISPQTGEVVGWIDLTGLMPGRNAKGRRDPKTGGDPSDVLNGIAYDAAGKRLFVTGKLWPKLFEIRVLG